MAKPPMYHKWYKCTINGTGIETHVAPPRVVAARWLRSEMVGKHMYLPG